MAPNEMTRSSATVEEFTRGNFQKRTGLDVLHTIMGFSVNPPEGLDIGVHRVENDKKPVSRSGGKLPRFNLPVRR